MADNNNVFILFEEIKTMLESMANRLEELPKVIDSNIVLNKFGIKEKGSRHYGKKCLH